MRPYRVVLDTNVIFAALDSKAGASRRLLLYLANGDYEAFVSGLLFGEYQGVLHRHLSRFGLSATELDDFLDGLASLLQPQPIYFTWRPTLKDEKDDMVLECAVAANADYLVTFNTRDFGMGADFVPKIVTPSEFLVRLESWLETQENPT